MPYFAVDNEDDFEQKIQTLQEKHDNELELRNYLDLSFHVFIDNLENLHVDTLKKSVTSNLTIIDNKVLNNDSKTEFMLPKGKYYFRQRFFELVETEGRNKFNTAYEIIGTKSDSLQVCYVDFIKVDADWKVNSISIDIN